METWRPNPRAANVVRRFAGLFFVVEALALTQGAVEARPEASSRAGPSFTQIFTSQHGYAKVSEFGQAYEFADGEAMNALAIVGLASVGVHFARGRKLLGRRRLQKTLNRSRINS